MGEVRADHPQPIQARAIERIQLQDRHEWLYPYLVAAESTAKGFAQRCATAFGDMVEVDPGHIGSGAYLLAGPQGWRRARAAKGIAAQRNRAAYLAWKVESRGAGCGRPRAPGRPVGSCADTARILGRATLGEDLGTMARRWTSHDLG